MGRVAAPALPPRTEAALRAERLEAESHSRGSTVALILNPAAGRGRGKRPLDEIRSRFPQIQDADIGITKRVGDEELLTTRALERSCSTLVVVGGDGTCARVADVVLRSPRQCSITVIPCGTGNDFAKTLGVADFSIAEIARLVEAGISKRIDVGHADGRYFLNSCGFGFDASVLEASNRVRFLKGDAVYIYSALRQLFTYRGAEVSTSVASIGHRQMLMVTVSNGRWLGGAFKIAPQASVLDGKLDACFVTDSNVVERAKLFAGALHGTHVGMPSVSMVSIEQLTLSFPSNPMMEVDGELRRAQTATVELKCIPRALSVIAAPGAPV